MNENNKMDCVLDEQLLLNTKDNDTELKEEQKIDIELKIPVEADADLHADPLQETAAFPCNFSWLFKDEDILLNEEQLVEVVLQTGKVRGKRGRPSNSSSSNSSSFISSSGQAWSLASAAQQDLLLPKQQACGKGPARNVSNAVESWMLLFDDEMLRMLLRVLNDEIRQRRGSSFTERSTDLTELRAWLGLSYLCGVFRNGQHNGPLDELWTLELGNAIFRATMSLPRFEFLADSLRNSSWNDAQRLWQKLLINCRSYYGPSGWLCVDEQPILEEMMPMCCDAKTLYMTNALLNKQQILPNKELMQLICDYKTTGRNITLSTRYAGLNQAEQLLQHNLSTICRLPVTSPDYPKNWLEGTLYNGALRLTKQAGVAWLSCGLSNQVNVLQTQLLSSQVCAQFHELSNRYSTAFSLPPHLATSKPAPFLQLLHLMLNISALNAWVLFRLSHKGYTHMEQRDFQRQLGLFLTQQRLQRRLHRRSTTTTLVMRLQICEILGQSSQRLLSEASSDAQQSHNVGVVSTASAQLPDGIALVSRYGEKHRRCKPCARNKRETKARSRCQQCQAHRCGNHLISRCYECMGLPETQLPDGNIKDS